MTQSSSDFNPDDIIILFGKTNLVIVQLRPAKIYGLGWRDTENAYVAIFVGVE
jgi:hypothetical protein